MPTTSIVFRAPGVGVQQSWIADRDVDVRYFGGTVSGPLTTDPSFVNNDFYSGTPSGTELEFVILPSGLVYPSGIFPIPKGQQVFWTSDGAGSAQLIVTDQVNG